MKYREGLIKFSANIILGTIAAGIVWFFDGPPWAMASVGLIVFTLWQTCDRLVEARQKVPHFTDEQELSNHPLLSKAAAEYGSRSLKELDEKFVGECK